MPKTAVHSLEGKCGPPTTLCPDLPSTSEPGLDSQTPPHGLLPLVKGKAEPSSRALRNRLKKTRNSVSIVVRQTLTVLYIHETPSNMLNPSDKNL